MPRIIAGATAALIATLLGTAPAGAVDLSGGTLRGGESASPTSDGDASMRDLAALDIGDPVPDANDQLDAMAAEDDAMADVEGDDPAFAFADDPLTDAPDMSTGDGPADADGTNEFGSFTPRERFTEEVPVLQVEQRSFQPVLPRASASVVPLGSWGNNNRRASTVVLGGSWGPR